MALGDKREAIMRAAESLFATRRFHEVTLDTVAQEAHVGKGTIYRYFADKDDLFFQIETGGVDDLCRLIREVKAGATFRERLLKVAERLDDFFYRRHQIFRMMHDPQGRGPCFSGDRHARFKEHRNRVNGAVGDMLAEGVAAGVLRAGPLEPEMLAAFFLAIVGARARDFERGAPDTPTLDQVLDLFLRGASDGDRLREMEG